MRPKLTETEGRPIFELSELTLTARPADDVVVMQLHYRHYEGAPKQYTARRPLLSLTPEEARVPRGPAEAPRAEAGREHCDAVSALDTQRSAPGRSSSRAFPEWSHTPVTHEPCSPEGVIRYRGKYTLEDGHDDAVVGDEPPVRVHKQLYREVGLVFPRELTAHHAL